MPENNEKSKIALQEEEILKFWKKNKIFEKSIEQREGASDYVFYDGPPFVTGSPHHGHILASTIKDMVPRYFTMKGFRVPRRWGWDCHGLPIENMIEKQLGISGREQIEEYGIDKFNQTCYESILETDKEWEIIVDRIGRWVEFKNSYKTMDLEYMESVWWAFKTLWDKELIYKDQRISLYCPRCETPISNFEVAMDNSYQQVKDPSIYIKIKLKNKENEFLLVWTTTPWTLPGNVALAVNKNIEYVKVKVNNELLILAKERISDINPEEEYPIEEHLMGSDLLDLEYEPVFNFEKFDKKAFYIINGDFVTTEEGTGVVHIAPAFGEDDFLVGKENNLPVFDTVDSQSKFLDVIKPWAGQPVWDANALIIEELKSRGLIFKIKNVVHSYPFCHRCETKLIYKVQPAWFVAVSKIKQRMVELNEEINWHPDHLKHGRFLHGLESAPDWNISRSRFWGTPLPVWICDSCGEKEVLGSVEELEKRAYKKVDVKDLHRQHVDGIELPCQCGGKKQRIPEVLDCWFESGSMPFASVHYPFENKEWFEKNYPAEFIAEYIAQTRGWFYNLHVLATALFDKPSFTNSVTTGTILAEDGSKMSKSKKNFTAPALLFNKYGVDAFRYYLMSSPLMTADNLYFSDKSVDEIYRKVVMLVWNIYNFYSLFVENDLIEEGYSSENVLDRWFVSKTNLFLQEVTENMDNYNIVKATRPIEEYINTFSTWYLRRSRDRFKSDNIEEKKAAINTAYQGLMTLAKVVAPVMPFISEQLYKKLNGPKESVHLEDWPKYEIKKIDKELLSKMENVRKACENILALRAENGIKVRQSLSKAYISFKTCDQELIDLIKEEVNIKEIILTDKVPQNDNVKIKDDGILKIGLDIKITPELKKEGNLREIIRQINELRKKMNLTLKDFAVVYYQADPKIEDLFVQFAEEIKKNTLTKELSKEKKNLGDGAVIELEIDGQNLWLGISL